MSVCRSLYVLFQYVYLNVLVRVGEISGISTGLAPIRCVNHANIHLCPSLPPTELQLTNTWGQVQLMLLWDYSACLTRVFCLHHFI